MEKRYIQLNSGPPVYSAGGGGGDHWHKLLYNLCIQNSLMFCVHGGWEWEIWPATSTVVWPSRSPSEERDRKRRTRVSGLCPHRARGRITPAGIWSADGDKLRQGRLGTSFDGGAPRRGTGGKDRQGRSLLARRNSWRRWLLQVGSRHDESSTAVAI